MRLLSLALIAHLFAGVSLQADDGNTALWEDLIGGGKGVYVAKLQNEGSLRYVFFPAYNRVRHVSALSSTWPTFGTLEEAACFVRAMPQQAVLLDAGRSEGVADDLGSLVALNPAELSAFGLLQLDLSRERREAEAKERLLKRVMPTLPE